MARQRNRREGTVERGLGWCLRTRGVVVVCLAVNHPHFDFLCCLRAQCPLATCGCPSSLCYSVGTLPCWWISTFCPWAAERTPAGLLRTTSRYRRAWVWISVWVNIWLVFCWGPFQMTAAAWNLKWLWAFRLFFSGVFIVVHCSHHSTQPLVELLYLPFTWDYFSGVHHHVAVLTLGHLFLVSILYLGKTDCWANIDW